MGSERFRAVWVRGGGTTDARRSLILNLLVGDSHLVGLVMRIRGKLHDFILKPLFGDGITPFSTGRKQSEITRASKPHGGRNFRQTLEATNGRRIIPSGVAIKRTSN